jgi:hypothetical protein
LKPWAKMKWSVAAVVGENELHPSRKSSKGSLLTYAPNGRKGRSSVIPEAMQRTFGTDLPDV